MQAQIPDFEIIKPFRWNIKKQNELGGLLKVNVGVEEINTHFENELITYAAKILAFSQNADIFFLGRSPESLYDKMSGLLGNTSWATRLEIVYFSMFFDDEKLEHLPPHVLKSYQKYLQALGLSPIKLLKREHPIVLVDLVYRGTTFGNFIKLLYNWCIAEKRDWKAIREKIKIIGITQEEKTSPKTWRWQQHSTIIDLIPKNAIKNISMNKHSWSYLGDLQHKLTPSFTSWRWVDAKIKEPNYKGATLYALQTAFQIFENGKKKEQKALFLKILAKQTAMKFEWYRKLIQEVNN